MSAILKAVSAEDANSPSEKQRVGKQQGVKASVFDEMEGDLPSTRGFWSRNVPLIPKNSSLKTVEGVLFKRSLQQNTWKSARYELIGGCLIRFAENSRRPIKFVRIENFRLEKLRLDEIREVRYGFRLTQNRRFVELYTRNKEAMQSWFEQLKNHCVLTSFANDYATIKLMGKGNFARVYYARSRLTGGEFAVKAFEKASFQQANVDRAALIKEISILRKLRHPAVLKMYEVYENDTHILLVNELLKGGELFHKLKAHGRFKEQYVIKLIHTLLDAIKYLAERNILHRDIKPENLILREKSSAPSPANTTPKHQLQSGGDNTKPFVTSPTKDRRPESWNEVTDEWQDKQQQGQEQDEILSDLCLADFGLADYYDMKGGYMFSRCGTPGYVAPEILADKIYDFKVDVFSVGVIMFILLTGSSPFKGSTYDEIVIKNYNCTIDYECKEVLDANISPVCMDLLRKMLKKDPVERLSAVEALAHPWIDRSNKQKAIKLQIVSDTQIRSSGQLHMQLQGGGGASTNDNSPAENQLRHTSMSLKSKTPLMNAKWDSPVDNQSPVTWKKMMNLSKVQSRVGLISSSGGAESANNSPSHKVGGNLSQNYYGYNNGSGNNVDSPKTNTPGGNQYSLPKQHRTAAASQHSKHFHSTTQLNGRKKLANSSHAYNSSKHAEEGDDAEISEFSVSSSIAGAAAAADDSDKPKSPIGKIGKLQQQQQQYKYRNSITKNAHLSFTNATQNLSQSNFTNTKSIREQLILNL